MTKINLVYSASRGYIPEDLNKKFNKMFKKYEIIGTEEKCNCGKRKPPKK